MDARGTARTLLFSREREIRASLLESKVCNNFRTVAETRARAAEHSRNREPVASKQERSEGAVARAIGAGSAETDTLECLPLQASFESDKQDEMGC